MLEKPYVPIDCSFHDRIEELATFRRTVRVVFQSEQGRQEVVDQIADWFVEKEAEFVRLRDGTIIRMDHIISVEDAQSR